MTFADAEYASKRKQTRKELFLIEMDHVVPWNGLFTLTEPQYSDGEGSRPAVSVDCDATRASDAELVRLPCPDDGGNSVRDDHPTSSTG